MLLAEIDRLSYLASCAQVLACLVASSRSLTSSVEVIAKDTRLAQVSLYALSSSWAVASSGILELQEVTALSALVSESRVACFTLSSEGSC